jgi:MFS family permease
MFQTPNNSAVMNHAPKESRGVASGMLATARNMGMVIGVALSGALFSLFSGQRSAGEALSDTSFAYGLRITFITASVVAVGAMIASLTADAFGAKHLPVNFGIIMLAYGLASFVGPRMAAVVKMINNGDYSLAFIIAIVFCGLGILLNFITMKQMNKVKRPVNLT